MTDGSKECTPGSLMILAELEMDATQFPGRS